MKEACGKGFVPSLLRGDPQHSPEDLHIGQYNENKTHQNQNSSKHEKFKFPDVAICAGELKDLEKFTEELVHSIAVAEW